MFLFQLSGSLSPSLQFNHSDVCWVSFGVCVWFLCDVRCAKVVQIWQPHCYFFRPTLKAILFVCGDVFYTQVRKRGDLVGLSCYRAKGAAAPF